MKANGYKKRRLNRVPRRVGAARPAVAMVAEAEADLVVGQLNLKVLFKSSQGSGTWSRSKGKVVLRSAAVLAQAIIEDVEGAEGELSDRLN